MLNSLLNLLGNGRREAKLDAKNCLARIMSTYDMTQVSYQGGIAEDRRNRDARHVALGVWLFPSTEDERGSDFNVAAGVPAVTHDLRPEGLGVMTPMKLDYPYFVVGTPDELGEWRFFRCETVHNTTKPGAWHKLGLRLIELVRPDQNQLILLREHFENVCRSVA